MAAVFGTASYGAQTLRFFFSSRRRHTRLQGDWSSDVCSSDLGFGPRRQPPPTPPALSARRCPAQRTAMAAQASTPKYSGAVTETVRRQREQRREEIGRASLGKEGRSRWSPDH